MAYSQRRLESHVLRRVLVLILLILGVAIFARPAAADLSLEMTATPDPVKVGEVLIYSFTVTNNGPDTVASVEVIDQLPATVALFQASIMGGTCDFEPCGGFACIFPDLEAGASRAVTLKVRPQAPGSITNTAVIDFPPTDPDPTNNEASLTTTVLPLAATGTLLSIDGDSPRLLAVDPNTAATLESTTLTLAGETIEGGNGLAVHPTTGEVWALLRLAGQDGRELVTLDPATGEAARVGDTGDRFAGLAFTPGARLFGITGLGASTPETLFQFSLADATPTFFLSLADGEGGEAITAKPNGKLVHASGGLIVNTINLFIPAVESTLTCTNLPPFAASALTYLSRSVRLLADRHDRALYGGGNIGMTRIGQLDHVSKGLALLPPCLSNETTLCLPAGVGRFELSVRYQTVQAGGRMGDARAVPLDRQGLDDGGLFYFINSTTPEFLIKVLDGCAINGHYWVFYAATTNVGFDLTVTDTVAEIVKTYTNPDLNSAATVLDTEAFATCGL